MNLNEFNNRLKEYKYTVPSINYKFLGTIVIAVGNSHIGITPRLSSIQYKLWYKLMLKHAIKE